MDFKKIWNELKEDIENAVEEGYECGYNYPESEEYQKFYVYQYILDKMKRLENKEN